MNVYNGKYSISLQGNAIVSMQYYYKAMKLYTCR